MLMINKSIGCIIWEQQENIYKVTAARSRNREKDRKKRIINNWEKWELGKKKSKRKNERMLFKFER